MPINVNVVSLCKTLRLDWVINPKTYTHIKRITSTHMCLEVKIKKFMKISSNIPSHTRRLLISNPPWDFDPQSSKMLLLFENFV